MIGFGQQTYVPDDVFEQALIDLGYDNVLDDFVLTANISSVTYLDVGAGVSSVIQTGDSILDLTGIEDFIALEVLNCARNKLTSLDVSQNFNLRMLNSDKNKLTNLNINNCINLEDLKIEDNKLTTLDLTSNINLIEIEMSGNLVTCLDVSHLSGSTNYYGGFELLCNDNLLEELIIDSAVVILDATNNNLTCRLLTLL